MTKSNRFNHLKSSTFSRTTSSVNTTSAGTSTATSVENDPSVPTPLDSASIYSLKQLGWNGFFQQQLQTKTQEYVTVARISAHHRSQYQLLTKDGESTLAIHLNMPEMTVGDWLLLDDQQHFVSLLERSALFSRKAAGAKVEQQLIAANLDWVFIVSSLNDDFNINRIERYLALVHEAKVTPVIVLTKVDLCDDLPPYIEALRELDSSLLIETVNGLDEQSTQALSSYCVDGKTVAFIGSSGVGKSTLVNALLGDSSQLTSAIRQDDSKGRHTTTSRSLHLTRGGGLLLDTPGMRELQLADCEEGLNETFADLVEYSQQCRFVDCQHEQEPGCAVQAAIENGQLTERRLQSYQKLMREQALNGASMAEKRAKGKSLSKMYKRVQGEARLNKRG
ncbi:MULTISPECIES: ribosome small subunit-dependent GTPase A [unclassified Shewanella]|uniref:ribosome small subunit-dependent GTPase A n=1 Tax=unclassified Shewanella TaxID=196818 RepID=UPI001BB8B57C|nr:MULTISPECIES: ribosome small subunit-dependent GTPase A [unclassified Shewanella]GIU09557.1 putative ribosome biogenesis GTPase RsgA 2 [Shewanella sp. MBTL60-112-B1]GIU34050.1 putative ribosome biogenesis GTPase RsgA 2 [Shewanella sp. MBTL60-112-B2]